LEWAHLIREVKFLSESKDKHYGKRLLDAIGKMFKTIHRRDRYKNWFRRMNRHGRGVDIFLLFGINEDQDVVNAFTSS
jgi:hypothetical protein